MQQLVSSFNANNLTVSCSGLESHIYGAFVLFLTCAYFNTFSFTPGTLANFTWFGFLVWRLGFSVWVARFRLLKEHRQISKKRCFEKYCSCDKAFQSSAL